MALEIYITLWVCKELRTVNEEYCDFNQVKLVP